MLALIIYGTRGITSTLERGRFYCPSCGPKCSYCHRQVRRYFTLYFIPIIPLDQLGNYIECQSCRATYKRDVLDYDPEAEREEAEAEFRTVMRRVMVDMMMADGVIDEEELKTLATIYEQVAEKPFSKRRLQQELDRLEQEGEAGTVAYLKGAGAYLNHNGKVLVLRAALAVAAADGDFQEEEQALVGQYATALGITDKQFRALVDEAFTS